LKAFVGVTDNDWFAFTAGLPGIDEVNFWQPSGNRGLCGRWLLGFICGKGGLFFCLSIPLSMKEKEVNVK